VAGAQAEGQSGLFLDAAAEIGCGTSGVGSDDAGRRSMFSAKELLSAAWSCSAQMGRRSQKNRPQYNRRDGTGMLVQHWRQDALLQRPACRCSGRNAGSAQASAVPACSEGTRAAYSPTYRSSRRPSRSKAPLAAASTGTYGTVAENKDSRNASQRRRAAQSRTGQSQEPALATSRKEE